MTRVRLRDGRQIAVEEFGDASGPPVLYFHGFPACRLEAGLIPDLPVRLIALDRPGYGGSSPHPGSGLLDWPGDVAQVADRLGLTRFHVLGLSGGGPYAAACAALLDRRVLSLTLVCPVPPVGALAGDEGGIGRLVAFGRRPGLAGPVFRLARLLVLQRILPIPRLLWRGLPAADAAILTAELGGHLVRVWREALRAGVEGALADARSYGSDWGFDLDRVMVPTRIWCAGQDTLVPLHTMAPFRRIPGARWHVLDEDGHFSLPMRHSRAMVAELLRVAAEPTPGC